ncbi:MAG: hypothetical protein Q4F00_07515 [bacterium]|nr:hypothetical protein [bacterium]
MVGLSGGVVLGMAVLGCLLGFFLSKAYAKQYGETAVQWGPFVLQLIFTGAVLANLPGDEPGDELSYELVLCLAGWVTSYVFALWKCWKRTKAQNADCVYAAGALAVQILLPLAVSLAVMVLLGVIVFGWLWEH